MDIKQFLQSSYTAYHAVDNARRILEEAGFVAVDIARMPTLRKGDRCYVVQGGTSLFAFVVGDTPQLMLAECHTDSPALRVKGSATLPSKEGNRINVEKYGGLILYSMLDIPLRVAGRVVCETTCGVASRLVVGPANVVIPSLCIHHSSKEDVPTLNVQNDMLPLLGDAADVYRWIAPDEKVLDADLYVVPDVAPYVSGAAGEYLSSPRIDNLSSMYAAVMALKDATPKGLAMVACFDNEEIGSGTQRGAGSQYLAQLVAAVHKAMGCDCGLDAVQSGLALSVDNGHAEHPAHPEKSDVTGGPVMGGGVVIKHHVNYATSGLSAGIFKRMLDKAGIPHQDYYNRSDIGCGSTLGNIAARALVIDTVDIGVAQLAMHSAVETAASKDFDTMQDAIATFLAGGLARHGDEIDIL